MGVACFCLDVFLFNKQAAYLYFLWFLFGRLRALLPGAENPGVLTHELERAPAGPL